MTRPPALSATRTKEYLQCPLKFRYSVVDGIPQPPTVATVKGNVVHKALEDLFSVPPSSRTLATAQGMLPEVWRSTLQRSKETAELFSDSSTLAAAQADTEQLLENYFRMERPENLHPRGREQFVDARLDSGILLRGIIDRIDEAPDGALRVVDYKTGRAPSPRFLEEALFQMRFYALLLRQAWRLPRRMQLLYLRASDVLTLDPHDRDIAEFEGRIEGIWDRIERDATRTDFVPRTSRLCDWCAYQASCPAFGGTIPPPSEEGLARLLEIRQKSAGASPSLVT